MQLPPACRCQVSRLLHIHALYTVLRQVICNFSLALAVSGSIKHPTSMHAVYLPRDSQTVSA